MKNRLVAFLVIILAFAMLTGCGGGISQAKYASAIAEKDNAERQLTEVRAELKSAQDQIVQLQASGGDSGSAQTGPTDPSRVSWRPVTYIDKTYGFKVSYPDSWKITTRGTTNVPVEIQYNIEDMVPGSWVSLLFDTADVKNTQLPMLNWMQTWQDYQAITSGDTVLADNTTPASYAEFIATVDTYLMHIYAVGYVDGDHWIIFYVWTIETVVPWDGNLMRQIAHTLNKATAYEIAHATTTPTTTPTTTTATTAAVSYTTYTDTTYKFTFKYDASWTATWNRANNPVSFGNATYYDPSVRVFIYPKATGATLADVLKAPVFMETFNPADPPGQPVIGATEENKTNVYGTKVTAITHQYTNTNASIAYCQSYGFLQGDNWIILFLTINSGWAMPLDSIYPDEVFSSWQFTQ